MKDKGILQEFSHVATVQDNAYIEALHSKRQREVLDRFEFDSIYHAQVIIDRYYKRYNEKGRHGSLRGKAPDIVYHQYFYQTLLNPKNYATTFEKLSRFIRHRYNAEQIIKMDIAKDNKNEVSLIKGGIENVNTNQCIVDILKGTSPAFDNRTNKYKIGKL